MKALPEFPHAAAGEASDHLTQAVCSHFLGDMLTSMVFRILVSGLFVFNGYGCLFEV